MTEIAELLENKLVLAKKKNKSLNAGDIYYNMSHEKRGLAIIFNHEYFDDPTVPRRVGTLIDGKKLESTLFGLGFKVQNFIDLRFKQIEDVIKRLTVEDFTDQDCILTIILTHGDEYTLNAKDCSYKPEVLYQYFCTDKCPTLQGKPKLFIFQACRGQKLDAGITVVKVETDEPKYNRSKDDRPNYLFQVPWHPDFLIAYSTVTGYYAWRNREEGSWFIQTLCKELDRSWRDHDLVTILTNVNRWVGFNYESCSSDRSLDKMKEAPCFCSMLTRKVQFSAN